MFFKGSRYAKEKTLELTTENGRVIHYKAVRLIPEITTDMGHRIGTGDRLDHIANRYFRDPVRFWRICDANKAMWPDDLVKEPGEIVRIPDTED